jgi:uncharacterized phage protein (TIGR01671 family)
MREIKFRICHETNSDKTIIYPDEHSDKYMIGIDGTVYENYGTKDKPLWENVFDATVFVQQYTGLKDKNGKEIYEGDICAGESLESRRFTVEFQDGGFSFIYLGSVVEVWVHNTTTTSFVTAKYVQVVGNIFEGLDK